MFHWRFILVGLLGAAWCVPAFAYVDPVGGAMLLQIVISGIAGAGLLFRKKVADLIRWIKLRIGSKSND